jgi:hypothetical protein
MCVCVRACVRVLIYVKIERIERERERERVCVCVCESECGCVRNQITPVFASTRGDKRIRTYVYTNIQKSIEKDQGLLKPRVSEKRSMRK